jgi:hypothetical protein
MPIKKKPDRRGEIDKTNLYKAFNTLFRPFVRIKNIANRWDQPYSPGSHMKYDHEGSLYDFIQKYGVEE